MLRLLLLLAGFSLVCLPLGFQSDGFAKCDHFWVIISGFCVALAVFWMASVKSWVRIRAFWFGIEMSLLSYAVAAFLDYISKGPS